MQAYQQLQNLFQYFRKAVNTKLTNELLRNKEVLNNKLKLEIEQYLERECHNIEDITFHQIVKNTRFWSSEIQKIINHKLEKPTRMPNETVMAFNLREATSLIPSFDGSASNLASFIDAVNFLADITPENQVATAIKFIKIKLTGKARKGLRTNVNTFGDLIADLERRCKSKETPMSLEAKLRQLNPSNKSEFCDAVENITQDLKCLYLDQGVPDDTANSLATAAGLNTLIEKIQCNNTKVMLMSGDYPDIQLATQKVRQYNKDSNTNNVFTVQHHNYQHDRGRGGRHNKSFPINNYTTQQHYRGRGRRGNNNFRSNFRGNRNFNFRNGDYGHANSRPHYNNNNNNNQNTYPRHRDNRIYVVNQDQPGIEAPLNNQQTNGSQPNSRVPLNFLDTGYTQ